MKTIENMETDGNVLKPIETYGNIQNNMYSTIPKLKKIVNDVEVIEKYGNIQNTIEMYRNIYKRIGTYCKHRNIQKYIEQIQNTIYFVIENI